MSVDRNAELCDAMRFRLELWAYGFCTSIAKIRLRILHLIGCGNVVNIANKAFDEGLYGRFEANSIQRCGALVATKTSLVPFARSFAEIAPPRDLVRRRTTAPRLWIRGYQQQDPQRGNEYRKQPERESYDAFISYSHAAESHFAPALQKWLQRYAKPWYRAKAMRVFRDETNLSVEPALWTSIQRALLNSRYFVLLASPEAAASRWVAREVDAWIQAGRRDKLLIVLIKGTISWEEPALGIREDFDWNKTDALPANLAGIFAEEPFWVDMRAFVKHSDTRQRDSQFVASTARIAAKIHDLDLDELIGEDIKQHRRTIRVARTTIISILISLALAVTFAIQVTIRNTMLHEARLTSSGRALLSAATLSAQRPSIANGNSMVATLMAVEGFHRMEGAGSDERAGYLHQVSRGLEPLLRSLHGHRWAVTHIAFSLSGTRLVSYGADHTVRVWDVATGTQAAVELRVERESLRAIAISPDGERIALAGEDGSLRLWDAEGTGSTSVPVPGHDGAMTAFIFSSDGTEGVSGGVDDTIRLWRLPAKEASNGLVQSCASVGAFPVGVGCSGTAALAKWSVPAGSSIIEFSSHGGRREVFSVGLNRTVQVWDASTGTEIASQTIGHDDGLLLLAVSLTSSLVALRSDSDAAGYELKLWDTLRHEYIGLSYADAPSSDRNLGVVSAAFSPRGDFLVAGYSGGKIRLFNTSSGNQLGETWTAQEGYTMGQSVNTLAFSPNEGLVASAGNDGIVRLWALPDVHRVLEHGPIHGEYMPTVSITSDGRFLFSPLEDDLGHSQMAIYNVKSGKRLEHSWHVAETYVRFAEVSPDGSLLVVGTDEERPQLWNVADQTLEAVELGQGLAVGTAATFSDDGARLAIAFSDKSIHVWDLTKRDSSAVVLSGRHETINALDFSADGSRLVSAHADGSVRAWDVGDDCRIPAEMSDGPQWRGAALTVAHSRKSSLVASAITNERIRVWDSNTGTLTRAPWQAHNLTIMHLAFSPTRDWLVSGGADGMARLWDARTGRMIGEWRVSDHWVSLARFTDDGRSIVAAGWDGTFRTILVDERALLESLCAMIGTNLSRSMRDDLLSSSGQLGDFDDFNPHMCEM